jgi:hypothetical protein
MNEIVNTPILPAEVPEGAIVIPDSARQQILKMLDELNRLHREITTARQTFALFLQFTKRQLKVVEDKAIYDIDNNARYFYKLTPEADKTLPADLSMIVNAPEKQKVHDQRDHVDAADVTGA